MAKYCLPSIYFRHDRCPFAWFELNFGIYTSWTEIALCFECPWPFSRVEPSPCFINSLVVVLEYLCVLVILWTDLSETSIEWALWFPVHQFLSSPSMMLLSSWLRSEEVEVLLVVVLSPQDCLEKKYSYFAQKLYLTDDQEHCSGMSAQQ